MTEKKPSFQVTLYFVVFRMFKHGNGWTIQGYCFSKDYSVCIPDHKIKSLLSTKIVCL